MQASKAISHWEKHLRQGSLHLRNDESHNNKKYELMLTKRAKTYSISGLVV